MNKSLALSLLAFIVAFLSTISLVSSAACITNNNPSASDVLGQQYFTVNTYQGTSQYSVNTPYGATSCPSGKIFVSDNANRILRFPSNPVAPQAAGAVFGQVDFVSPYSGLSNKQFNGPSHIHCDNADNLWVADYSNHRVVAIKNASTAASYPSFFAIFGQSTYSTATASTTQNGLRYPNGVFCDSAGSLFVADYGNHRVLRYDGAATKGSGINPAQQVIGQTSYSLSNTGSFSTQLYNPTAVVVDKYGHLFVADTGNNRVLRYNEIKTKGNGAAATNVLGQSAFGVSGGGTGPNKFYNPIGLAIHNGQNRLLVTDATNHRVLLFLNSNTFTDGKSAAVVVGQPNGNSYYSNQGSTVKANTLYYPAGIVYTSINTFWVADRYNYRVVGYCT